MEKPKYHVNWPFSSDTSVQLGAEGSQGMEVELPQALRLAVLIYSDRQQLSKILDQQFSTLFISRNEFFTSENVFHWQSAKIVMALAFW